MANFNLEKEARSLAGQFTELVNGTVADGVRIQSVVVKPGRVQLGYGIDKQDQIPKGIPLGIGRKSAAGYLGLSMRLIADPDSQYLTVESSVMGLFVDQYISEAIFHYDYERHKQDDYPEAHLQVAGDPPGWRDLCLATRGDERAFERLHLPVGGRRYRPALEDLLEFLIREGIAEGRPGAMDLIESRRAEFVEKQLRAAVRRHPEVALAALRRHAPDLLG